jgi:hypothetical protein
MSAPEACRLAHAARNAILLAAMAGLGLCPVAASATPSSSTLAPFGLPTGEGIDLAGNALKSIDPSQFCRAAIAATERTTGIPDAFLSAIGRVESGRDDGGGRSPWPWTVNAAGAGHFYQTKQAAIDAVRQFFAAGVRSLDVGCLQVNLQYHPDAFPDLEQAFDPADNAAYAGRLLLDLFRSTGSWPRAAAAYHSMTPALGSAYLQQVLAEWAMPDRTRPGGHQTGHRQDRAARLAPPPDGAPGPPSPARAGAPTAPPATFGFSRRVMLAQDPAQGRMTSGRTLAAYRAVPVRVAMGQMRLTP